MGKVTGFMEYARRDRAYEPVDRRLRSWREFTLPLPDDELALQGARCMDCGIPFCHQGCPVDNIIPEWNDLVYRRDWRAALEVLHSTNNFPEFTGRICPAPCEQACVLAINDDPVTIKTIECAIIDRGWEEGWVAPEPPTQRSGKRVAVVGSGPAGMACAQQLARAGHEVVLFEKETRIGGLMRYGIPDFKFEKFRIDRRIEQMRAEGVEFRTGVHVGVDLPARDLVAAHDAVVLAGGAEEPRDLAVPGRELEGIHFAMPFLVQQNKRNAGDAAPADEAQGAILATGRNVVVIGGGDTGSDCIGTANRQRAASVTSLEILPRPPEQPDIDTTWPYWPLKLWTSSSHEEGGLRDWSVSTRAFLGDERGRVRAMSCVRVEWREGDDGRMNLAELPGSEFEIETDLVLLAMGFVHPVHRGMLEELGIDRDERGNVKADTDGYRASDPKIFTAGDMRRGQSLVVWAIREGRQCARAVDEYLMGDSELPR